MYDNEIKQKGAIDMVNCEDNIVTLLSDKGEEIDFIEIINIGYKGNFYTVLQPVLLLEGMSDDEALVFKVTKGTDGKERFEIELEEAIIDWIFQEYQKILSEANNEI